MEQFVVRKATFDDFEDIKVLIERARALMVQRNNPQWSEGYPPLDLIKEDIEKQRLYVSSLASSENEIKAMIVIQEEKDPIYDEYDFWSPGKYVSFHRIISFYSGMGKYLIKMGIEEAKESGRNARIDTHEKNIHMQKLIESLGFKFVGKVDFEYSDKALSYGYEIVV